MFVRGDISILIPDLFRCAVAILTAPAVYVNKIPPPQKKRKGAERISVDVIWVEKCETEKDKKV